MTMRSMIYQDINVIAAMEARCYPAPWPIKIFRGCLLVGYDCRVFEAIINEKPAMIGYLIAREEDEVCHILNFCIDLPFQQQGFGKQFLTLMIQSLDCDKIKKVILEVRSSNQSAIKLYEGLGFRFYALKEQYYQDEHGVEDALVFKKNLNIK